MIESRALTSHVVTLLQFVYCSIFWFCSTHAARWKSDCLTWKLQKKLYQSNFSTPNGNLITWHGSFNIHCCPCNNWKLESWLSFCEHSQSSNITWRGNLETIPDLPCFAICWGLFFLLNYVKSTNCCQFGFSYANVALLHWGKPLTWKTSKCDNIFV